MQASVARLEQQGVVTSEKVEPGHVKRNPRADAGASLRLVRLPRIAAAVYFQSKTIVKGVAFCLFHLEQDIFVVLFAIGVLYGRIHLVEDAEIIETALCVKHLSLTERIAFMHLDFPVSYIRAGKVQSREEGVIHENLTAFCNLISECHSRRIGRDLPVGSFKLHVGKAIVEVIIGDVVPVRGDVGL